MSRRETDDVYQFMNSDTVKRAEELCASMSSTLDLERRGQAIRYEGALSDLSQSGNRFIKVVVADMSGGGDQLTLISDAPLAASTNALLVYRRGPGREFKYLGRHSETHPGQRPDDDDQERHITRYTILRDVRDRA